MFFSLVLSFTFSGSDFGSLRIVLLTPLPGAVYYSTWSLMTAFASSCLSGSPVGFSVWLSTI